LDDVARLVKALIRENAYDLLIENRKYLEFALPILEDEHSTKALAAFIDCALKINKCPKNISTVLDHVINNTHHNPDFEKSDLFEQQLTAIKNDEDEQDDEVDAAQLADRVYTTAYEARLSQIYTAAGKIATGTKNPHTKEAGPDAAKAYINEEEQKLVKKAPPQASGDLIENIDFIEKYIDGFIIGQSKRVYTGFKKIDEVTLIGRNQRNRWIGIMGYTHHGKSLLLTTMIYNMACAGANVVLVPRESSVEEAWMTLVWLHHSKVCPDRPLVDKAEWMRSGADVGTENYNTVKMILKDLKEGTSIPGKLIVEPCRSWEEIEEKLRMTNKKRNYDVLAIDYFAHLDTAGGSKGDSDIDKYKKALRKAQLLTLDGVDNDKSGLVIITPLQVNRKGYEECSKQENDLYGVYQNLNAVEYFTQAAQDMDCVMSVWFEGDSCKEVNPQQMIVHCLKGRGNMKFPTHRLAINPMTGMLHDFNAPAGGSTAATEYTAESLGDPSDVLYTKTTINTDDWGI
jgi:hypothetical protein